MFKLRAIRTTVAAIAVSLLVMGSLAQASVSANGSSTAPVKGTFSYVPVLVPYCPAGQACPKYDLQFPFPYQLSIYQEVGSLRLSVKKNLPQVGPASNSIQLRPDTYDVTYNAGELATEYPAQFTIYPGQTYGVLKLHFILPANGQNYFKDYNGCVYNLGGSSASPAYCQVK